jgi:tripeptide aminopeptidase
MIDEKLLNIFLELVKIEGLSGNERNVADYIMIFLKNLNLFPVEDNLDAFSGSSAGNVICKIGSGGDFVLLSHMDTARSTKDLKPIVSGNKITSDGTTILGSDNRAGIAIILYAIEKFLTEKKLVKDFTVAFSICEETTMSGSKNLNLNPGIKMGFVFDSSFRPGNFIFQTPGAVSFSVKIIGRASHSGLFPEKGINSIKIASKAVSDLDLGRIDSETTANIGIIKGGSAVNVVPEITIIDGEVRSMDLSKVERKAREIKDRFEAAAKVYGGKIEYNYFWDFKPYKISPQSDVYKEISMAIKNTGLNPSPAISFGGSDANSLNEKGILSIDIGIGAQNPHSNEEFILLEDLEKSADIVMNLIKQNPL